MNRRSVPSSRRARLGAAVLLAAGLAGGFALLGHAQAASTTGAAAQPAATSHAVAGKLLWSAVPGNAAAKEFASVQCPTNTFTTVNSGSMGRVWQVVQPSKLERCEGVGPTVAKNNTYYLGWSSKFHITDGMSRYIFQEKCDPSSGTANHPVVLEVVNGKVELQEWTPKHTMVLLWSTTAVNDKWSKYALRITENRSKGAIQFWYNGVPQKLSGGSYTFSGSTYDGSTDYLKWGLYHPSKGSATQWLSTVKVGTSLDVVTG